MTIKQKQAIERTVENGGNITQAMRDVGYSEATINNPKNLTESKGFQEAANDYKNALFTRGINGAKLAAKMEEWLDAKKISTSLTEPDRIVNDYQTQLKAGEMLREDFGLLSKQGIQILNQGEMDIEFIGNETNK